MDKVSTPPGFVSHTSFVLRNVHRDNETFRPLSGQEQITGSDSDDAFEMFLKDRPWILHDHITPLSEVLKPMESQIQAKRLPKVSETKVLDEAPVFHPSEEEFSDTLSYIASLRDRAEPYGICCVVPPPSWKPPCLLKEKKIWEASKFATQVQLFDGMRTENPDIKKETDTGNDDDASEKVKVCRIARGHMHTLESFKIFADSYKKDHFSIKEDVLGSNNSSPSVKPEEPTVEDIEKEYRQLVESPLLEIGVFCGKDLDTRKFGSGFPLSGPSESCKYGTSGWNLNNTAKLPGSLLSLEDCESICVPRLCVGMCFSSQSWKSEKERLYSLCYLHMGAPRVWYSVAGSRRSEFTATMTSLIPEMSGEQPKVMVVSPYALSMEGIPVTRCVQNPGQYVIIFPGSYYSAFNCGFNCLEKANFAPLDWLPHGDIAVQLNQDKRRKSLILYDKVLLSAASEAVKCKKESTLSKKNPANYKRWEDSCGKDGLLTNIVKSRVKKEKSKREFLSKSLKMQRMDKSYDGLSRMECCVCYGDLHLSAVQCSCSADRYSCLNDMRKLCSCPCDRKSLLYRYSVDELNLLVEALEGKLSAMLRWANIDGSYCVMTTSYHSQGDEKDKKSDEVERKDSFREQMKARVKARSMVEIMNVKDGKHDDAKEPLKSCSKKSSRPCDSSSSSSEVDWPKKQRQG